MSRWRLGLAITLTIVAIPLWLQAAEPDAAAGTEKVDAPGDPDASGYALLADRAAAWGDLRADVAEEQQQAELAAAAVAAAAATTTTTTTLAPTTTRAVTTTRPPTTTVATTKPPTTKAPTTTVPTTRAPTTTKAPTTTAKPTTTVPPTTAVPAPPAGLARALPAGTTAEMWHQLRMCESGGNYHAVSAGGAYRGAYQFMQSTWNTIASSTPSLNRLMGVDPATAAPVDQDSMAYTLYEQRGKSPWPICGAPLP